MRYWTTYPSPVGRLYLSSDGEALTGLWIEGQKHFPGTREGRTEPGLPVFRDAAAWLDAYFAQEPLPPSPPPLSPSGTAFQRRVWELTGRIPYGHTVSYGELADRLSTSPQAVGGAMERNPILLLIPCHRVVGADGSLTGYAGGLAAKVYLLALEGADLRKLRL